MLSRIENKAFSLGLSQFDWWKDWRGQHVAIIASGYSVKKQDVTQLAGRLPTLAIKKNIEIAPFADVVYGCDAPWWQSVKGLPNYSGLRLSYNFAACREFPDIKRIEIKDKKSEVLLFDEPASVGSGGNSGFQALNIALQFGAAGVMLIGFDMMGDHWYGRNNWPSANNPTFEIFKRWVSAFNAAKSQTDAMGIEIVNTSAKSAITAFPKMSIEQALERWSL